MRISHKYKFIFFSNPKTGSESVRALLAPYSDFPIRVFSQTTNEFPFYSHITPYETLLQFDTFGWDFDAYNRFVFVRNPWARLVSLFEMICRNQQRTFRTSFSEWLKSLYGMICRNQRSTFRMSFSEWVKSIKPNGIGGGGNDSARWRKYGTYSIRDFITDPNDKIIVDAVLKLEEINIALPRYLRKLNLPGIEDAEVPCLNIGITKDYRKYYTSETAELVANIYAFDIEKYDYSF